MRRPSLLLLTLLTNHASGWRPFLTTISTGTHEVPISLIAFSFLCNRPAPMQRYVPPHMRQRGIGSSSAQASPRTPDPSSSTRNVDLSAPVSTAPQRLAPNTAPSLLSSRRPHDPRHTPPSRSALASPASDIRPMRPSSGGRTQMDEMEMVQSVSRSGGDGAEGDAWVQLKLVTLTWTRG